MEKTWFITGVSSGFGKLMTEHLLARGDRVVGTVRRKDALVDLKKTYGDRLVALQLDITDTDGIRATVDEAFRRVGKIDTVVSNAGYAVFGAAEEITDTQLEHQIATNLTGSIQLIRAVLPYLRQQGGGRIMQVSSEGGQIAYPNFSLYHATKWGVEGFIESVAQEVAGFGIDFIVAEPGPTGTQFAANLVRPELMAVYDETPVGDMRRALADGTFTIKGDAKNTVTAMIAAADNNATSALRLALGSTAYNSILNALLQRLRALEAQKEVAFSADMERDMTGVCEKNS